MASSLRTADSGALGFYNWRWANLHFGSLSMRAPSAPEFQIIDDLSHGFEVSEAIDRQQRLRFSRHLGVWSTGGVRSAGAGTLAGRMLAKTRSVKSLALKLWGEATGG